MSAKVRIARPPTVCYVHIAKTAGASVRLALEHMLGGRFVYWEQNWHGPFETADLRRCVVVAGHMPAATLESRAHGPVIFATVLRDPMERAVSLFNFIATNPLRSDCHEFRAMGLERAVFESEAFIRQIRNRQCELIGAEPTFDAAMHVIGTRPWIIETMDTVSRMVPRIAAVLNVRACPLPRYHVAAPGYRETLLTERIAERIGELNREDRKLLAAVQRGSRMP